MWIFDWFVLILEIFLEIRTNFYMIRRNLINQFKLSLDLNFFPEDDPIENVIHYQKLNEYKYFSEKLNFKKN